MKRIILLFILITISIAASAQIRLGVRAAVTFNDLLYIHTQDADLKSNSSNMLQFNAAALANYKFNTFFSLQTEFIYTTLGKITFNIRIRQICLEMFTPIIPM